MDSDALKTFLTVHREGGISSAARALHRTQPAISRRIALLEQELGVPLFERAPAARAERRRAGDGAVCGTRRSPPPRMPRTQSARCRSPNAGPVALAIVGTLAGGRLSRMMQRFRASDTDADLTLRTATSAEVSDPVRRGEATIGLRYDHDRSRDLDCELLTTEPLTVVCAPDHPLAGRRVAQLAELRDAALDCLPGSARTPRDCGGAYPGAVSDARARRGEPDAGRQPDGAEAAGGGWLRSRTFLGQSRRRRNSRPARWSPSASAISSRDRRSSP